MKLASFAGSPRKAVSLLVELNRAELEKETLNNFHHPRAMLMQVFVPSPVVELSKDQCTRSANPGNGE